ncbi:MAG TPA: hypothetical protein VJ742_02330 [Nitrososphaera sp.]|nr:hypothetical protein [Nitrososphaera sp.]
MFLVQNLAASTNIDNSASGDKGEIFRQGYKFGKAHFNNAIKIPIADII